MASFHAAGTAYSTFGEPMIPFYIFYSMFGFQRTMDSIWSAADQRSRGFLLGATAGRTTLNGEGLQHQDGHSLLLASAMPAATGSSEGRCRSEPLPEPSRKHRRGPTPTPMRTSRGSKKRGPPKAQRRLRHHRKPIPTEPCRCSWRSRRRPETVLPSPASPWPAEKRRQRSRNPSRDRRRMPENRC